MTLPHSRNTDYAALSQVKSADLNDLQDGQIEFRHGSIKWVQSWTNDAILVAGTITYVAGSVRFDSDGAAANTYFPWARPNLVISGVRVRVQDVSAGAIVSATLTEEEDGTLITSSGTAVDSDASGNWQWLTLDLSAWTDSLIVIPDSPRIYHVNLLESGSVTPPTAPKVTVTEWTFYHEG